VLTARTSKLRDWGLFAAAALLPAAAVGVLGLRALANEEAGARRELALGLDAAAERVARDVERGTARAAAVLATTAIDADAGKAGDALKRIAPPFAEPVVLGKDRALLVPIAPGETTSSAPPIEARQSARCDAIVAALGATAPRDEGERAGDGRALVAECPEARSAAGRFLWPLFAIDAVARGEVPGERVAAWIEAHAARLGEAEREATRIEAERALAGEARERAVRVLSASWSRRDAIAAAIGANGAASALRSPPDPGGFVTWRAEASAGTLRALGDGRLAGFVVDKGSIEAALASGAIALPRGMRATVVTGASAARAEDAKRDGGDRLVATSWIAPELALRVTPADPEAVARRASKSRRILAALGAFATLGAFGLAAILFARMRAARRSSALRTDFVAAVSHELRTPIASLRMLAELLEEGRVEPEEQREIFEALARESRRLGETVDRLLGFSRMAAGRYTIERAEADLSEVAAAAIDTFEERSPEIARVRRDLDEGVIASVDAGQIRLAIDNLLVNAKKYAPEGAPYEVSVKRADGGVAIAVADRGPGIARRDQARIFEPFERADDRLSRATEGSGIGLSLVAHVARAHGGRAYVESEPGRGARFTIWIPLARSA
jgi:two-component system phosphate regulon sensor histidine kinase PhoR